MKKKREEPIIIERESIKCDVCKKTLITYEIKKKEVLWRGERTVYETISKRVFRNFEEVCTLDDFIGKGFYKLCREHLEEVWAKKKWNNTFPDIIMKIRRRYKIK